MIAIHLMTAIERQLPSPFAFVRRKHAHPETSEWHAIRMLGSLEPHW
jgi:hypothetical protein